MTDMLRKAAVGGNTPFPRAGTILSGYRTAAPQADPLPAAPGLRPGIAFSCAA
jgi:hypothetical protein